MVPQVVSTITLVQELRPSLRMSVHSPNLLYKRISLYLVLSSQNLLFFSGTPPTSL